VGCARTDRFSVFETAIAIARARSEVNRRDDVSAGINYSIAGDDKEVQYLGTVLVVDRAL